MLSVRVHLNVVMEYIDVVNNDDDSLRFEFDCILQVILFHEKELQNNDIKRIDHP
jgi:hypothetical protein